MDTFLVTNFERIIVCIGAIIIVELCAMLYMLFHKPNVKKSKMTKRSTTTETKKSIEIRNSESDEGLVFLDLEKDDDEYEFI